MRNNLDMFCTCEYAASMSKMIQIRNVPNSLHGRLKARAALAGMSLSDYLLVELRQVGERPSLEEMHDRLSRLPALRPRVSPADVLRAERERR
jgi:hypothetical protein